MPAVFGSQAPQGLKPLVIPALFGIRRGGKLCPDTKQVYKTRSRDQGLRDSKPIAAEDQSSKSFDFLILEFIH